MGTRSRHYRRCIPSSPVHISMCVVIPRSAASSMSSSGTTFLKIPSSTWIVPRCGISNSITRGKISFNSTSSYGTGTQRSLLRYPGSRSRDHSMYVCSTVSLTSALSKLIWYVTKPDNRLRQLSPRIGYIDPTL